MAYQFPQQARRGAADQRVLRGQPANRHEIVDRGDEQDLRDHTRAADK